MTLVNHVYDCFGGDKILAKPAKISLFIYISANAKLVRFFVGLFDWALELPVMSVPVVGFSFKPKGLALATPLFHQSGYGVGSFNTKAGEGTN